MDQQCVRPWIMERNSLFYVKRDARQLIKPVRFLAQMVLHTLAWEFIRTVEEYRCSSRGEWFFECSWRKTRFSMFWSKLFFVPGSLSFLFPTSQTGWKQAKFWLFSSTYIWFSAYYIISICSERGDDWGREVSNIIEFGRDLPAVDAVYHQV